MRSSASPKVRRRSPHTSASRPGTVSTTFSHRSARLYSILSGAPLRRPALRAQLRFVPAGPYRGDARPVESSDAELLQRGLDSAPRRRDEGLLPVRRAGGRVGLLPQLGLERPERSADLGQRVVAAMT